MDAPFSFNRSVGIGSRRDRITGDSGALTGRELLGRCGTIRRCGWPPATGRARLRWARPGACPRSRRCRGGWRHGRRRRVPEVLREGLQRLAGWRLKAMGGWRRPKTLVIDIDSLPVEVHGNSGQRVERLLSPARVSSDRGGGGGDGRHPGPAAARGAGPHGGRRAGVRARGAGAGGAASVREGRRALRRGISRRAADGGAGGAGHALCGPGAWATPC